MTDISQQPASLVAFKHISHAYYSAYCMSNVGMKDTAESLKQMDGFNLEGVFQIGPKSPEHEPIAQMPTKYMLQAMTKDGPFSQMIAHGLVIAIFTLWEDSYRLKIAKELGIDDKNEIGCDLMGVISDICATGSPMATQKPTRM